MDLAGEAPAIATRSKPLFRRGDTETLAWWQLIAFSLPAVPLAAMTIPLGFLLPPFYTGEMGVSLTTYALVIFVARAWDIATDPIVGMLCDRFASRWGRRRHWVVLSAPLLMLGAALVFMPQLFVHRVTAAYLLLAMLIMNFGATVKSLNSIAWGGELSEHYHERSRIMGWRGAITAIASLVAFLIPSGVELLRHGATTADKLVALGWFVIVLTPITTLLSVAAVGEKPTVPSLSGRRSRLWSSILVVLSILPLRRVILIQVLMAVPLSVMTSLFIFYVSYVLGAPKISSSLLLVPFGSGMLSVPLWMRLARGREKHKMLALGFLGFGATLVPYLFLGRGDLLLFGILIFFAGIFNSGPAFLMNSIVVDIVDVDVANTGERRTGTFFAVMETMTKLAPTLAVTALFPILQAFHFDPTGKHNTVASLAVVKWTFALCGGVPSLHAAWLMWNFPLGKTQHDELRRRIASARTLAES